jgi:hypothetical protein
VLGHALSVINLQKGKWLTRLLRHSDVLHSIQREWDFVATDDCVPVQVALQLMDTSTLGKAEREPDFLDVHQKIQQTLKAIVNGWYLPL